jgi:hypothetical protein
MSLTTITPMLMSIMAPINTPGTNKNVAMSFRPLGTVVLSMQKAQPHISRPNKTSSRMRSATGVSSANMRLRIGGIAGSVNRSEHTTLGNLIGGFSFANDSRIFFGEERHPHPNLFLIFFQDCVEEGNEFLDFLRVCLAGYLAANLAHDIDVVHLSSPCEDATIGPSGRGIQ